MPSPFDKFERSLNRKIDRVRVKLELGKPASPEITDPVEIEKKVARAKEIFSKFLYTKKAKKSGADAGFSITFDNMATTLELSYIPPIIAKEKMDEIVLSAPGITKTETGYMVSDPDLLYENFGPGAIKKKVTQFLSTNSNRSYSHQAIAKELDLSRSAVQKIIVDLVSENKVTLVEKSKFLGWRRGSTSKRFKIAE